MIAAAVLLTAAAAIYLPGVIDRALRNRRARKARQRIRGTVVSRIDAMVQAALEDGLPTEDQDGYPVLYGETPIHDQIVCEQMERAEGWSA